jgi:hypothetical protein
LRGNDDIGRDNEYHCVAMDALDVAMAALCGNDGIGRGNGGIVFNAGTIYRARTIVLKCNGGIGCGNDGIVWQ